MRALSTCLSVILGMSVCYLAACSSDSDATGGAGGGTSMAGSSGKAGSSGSPGAAGAPGDCAFESDVCGSCLMGNCKSEVTACASAADCGAALAKLDGCACGGEMTAAMCETAFIAEGGDEGQPLVDCFNQNCASVCAM